MSTRTSKRHTRVEQDEHQANKEATSSGSDDSDLSLSSTRFVLGDTDSSEPQELSPFQLELQKLRKETKKKEDQ